MANIPTIPGFEMAQTPDLRSAKLNPSAAGYKERGAAALSSAVSNVGEVMVGFAKKMQDTKDTKAILDADILMTRSAGAFRDEMLSHPGDIDTQKWADSWKKESDRVNGEVAKFKSNMSPSAIRHLDGMSQRWAAQHSLEFSSLAKKALIRETSTTGVADATIKAEHGDIDGANAVIDTLVKGEIMSPKAAEIKKKELGERAEVAKVDTGIENNPYGTMKALESGEFKNLPEQSRISLIRKANEHWHRVMGENRDKVLEEYDAHPETFNKAQLDYMVENKLLSATSRDALIHRNSLDTARFNKETYNYLATEAQTHDFSVDKSPVEEKERMLDAGAMLPADLRRQYVNKVNSAFAASQKAERPVESMVLGQLKKDYANGYMLPGTREKVSQKELFSPSTWFKGPKEGEVKEPSVDKRTEWQKTASKEDRDAADLHFAQLAGKMHDFFNSHPNASYEEAEKYRQEISQPYVMEAVKRNLVTTPQRPASEDENAEAIKWAKANPDDPRAAKILGLIGDSAQSK